MAIVDIDTLEGLKLLYKPGSMDRKALLLGASDGAQKQNLMPFTSWSISHVDPHGWCFAVYVMVRHYTHLLIEKTGQYTVNVPQDGTDDMMQRSGSMSGRDHDKFTECGLTPVASTFVKPPIIEECVAHFECEMYNRYPFTMTFPGEDKEPLPMTVFEGRVLVAHVNEELVRKIS